MFINPFEHIITLFAPHECAICKAECYMLCPGCAETNLALPISRCYLCNRLTNNHQICSSCSGKSRLRRVWWLGNYEALLKELILEFKYQHKRAYAREFGAHLASVLPYLPEHTLVVPVPTATRRIRRRGYDQAYLIAAQFARSRGFQLLPVLRKITQADQIGKQRGERFRQMQKSLSMAPGASVKGTHILLIDDVLTTGATLEAAAQLLRSAGARHVDAAVIARHLRT